MASRSTHRVVVLALEGVYPFELGIPSRVFGTAADEAGRPLYDIVVCTVDGRPVRTEAGFSVAVEHGPEALESADTVVIPPTSELDKGLTGDTLPEPVAAALGRIRTGARLVSFDEAMAFAKYVHKLQSPPDQFCDSVFVGAERDAARGGGGEGFEPIDEARRVSVRASSSVDPS